MARFGDFDQYLDNAGDPLAEGKLYFYESGTTTPKTTYSDVNNSIPNTNPVLLSAAGRQPNIFFDGVAKVILTDNDDVQLIVRDPVGETATDFGDQWVATKIYNATDVVLGSDGVYYRSLINGNQGNNPVTTTGNWTLLYSVEWNAGITYQVGAVVTYDGEQYQSLQGSNLNQNPLLSLKLLGITELCMVSHGYLRRGSERCRHGRYSVYLSSKRQHWQRSCFLSCLLGGYFSSGGG
jgi:hypothetical protein